MPVQPIQGNTCRKINVLHEQNGYEITQEFPKVTSILARHSRNIMLSETFVKRTPAVVD